MLVKKDEKLRVYEKLLGKNLSGQLDFSLRTNKQGKQNQIVNYQSIFKTIMNELIFEQQKSVPQKIYIDH